MLKVDAQADSSALYTAGHEDNLLLAHHDHLEVVAVDAVRLGGQRGAHHVPDRRCRVLVQVVRPAVSNNKRVHISQLANI